MRFGRWCLLTGALALWPAGGLELDSAWESGGGSVARGDYVPLRLVCETLGGRVTCAGHDGDALVELAGTSAVFARESGLVARTTFEPNCLQHPRPPVWEDHRRWSRLEELVATLKLASTTDDALRLVTLSVGDKQVRVFRGGSLWRAAATGDLAWLERLVAAGRRVDERDLANHTPLHWAACEDHPAVVRWLLDHGAEVDARDWDGNTPLICAAETGAVECVRLLLRHGASVRSRAKDYTYERDRTPWRVAKSAAVKRLLRGRR